MATIRTNGYVCLRRGLLEHVTDGSMTVTEGWLFVAILANADPKTGVWNGSANALAVMFDLNKRTCQRALDHLETGEYIKRFQVAGKTGSYPILVHNFECSLGSLEGMRLDAFKSMTSEGLIYSRVADVSLEPHPEVSPEATPECPPYIGKEKRNKRQEKKPSRAKREPDERHTPCRKVLENYWEHKNPGGKLPWQARDAKALGEILSASPDLTVERFRKLLWNRARSDVSHGDRVYLWIAKLHSYAEPLNKFNKPETSNGANGQHNRGAAVGRVNRSGAGFGAVTERRVAQATGTDAAATVSSVPASGSGAGNSGDIFRDVREPGDSARNEESRDGPAVFPDAPEILPPSQRSVRGT